IIVTGNLDGYDRSADKMNTGYSFYTLPETSQRVNNIGNFSGREERVDRGRAGASVVSDYRIPFGRITGNAFFNRLTNEGIYRVNQPFDAGTTRIFYNMDIFDNRTSILTSALGVEQEFEWMQYDVGVSRTASRTRNPLNYSFTFAQEGDAISEDFEEVLPGMTTGDILRFVTPDSSFTGLSDMRFRGEVRNEDQYTIQGNVQVPFRIGSFFDGYVKTGGKFRWLDRLNDESQRGLGGLHYGVTSGSQTVVNMRCAEGLMPPEYQDAAFADMAIEYGLLPILVFDDGYTRTNFLDGEMPLGYTADPEMARLFAHAMDECTEEGFLEDVIASRGRDYTGEERYQAAYLMTEINIGRYLTFTPGFRWERDWTRYTGQQFREVVRNNQQAEPTDLAELVSERDNSFFLPMLHLRVRPTEWLQIHLARTETLSRPDFIQYVPITRIDAMQQFAFAGNTGLRPSHTTNYDASMSIFERRIGLFTVSAFHKTMTDHIRWTRMFAIQGTPPAELNIPDSWLVSNPVVDTYINNPFDATYRGFELDWQTNFWYLPSVMRGLVLSVNYTRILSDTRYQTFERERVCVNCPSPRPRYEFVMTEIEREGRMLDQPAHIANITVGYDFRGFSTRFSYLYQTDRFSGLHPTQPAGDQFSGDYSRFDLMVRQRVGGGLELFSNFNNLTSTPDRNFRGGPSGDRTFIEYYGFTMDIGARYRF
ncbi:MAG: TonB-dependent receptor domain-containing protein, partial [Rhodothermales bacterium]